MHSKFLSFFASIEAHNQEDKMALSNNIALYNPAFQGTPYVFASARNLGGRVVEKYLFNNQVNQAGTLAARAIRALLADHQNLRPTFTTNLDSLEAEVVRNVYLTINGNAVSLAEEQEAPGEVQRREFKDRFFSEALIQEPAHCLQDHWFELSRARIWAEQMQNICPAGNHLIGNLVVDDEARQEIQNFRQARQQQQQMNQNFIDRQQLIVIENAELRIQQQRQQRELNYLKNRFRGNIWSTVGIGSTAVGKVVLRFAFTQVGTKICTEIGKIIAQKLAVEGGKEVGKNAAKSIVKQLPVISFFIGCGLAVYRCSNGEYWRAVGEFASGFAACFPGHGTAVSIAIDIAMAGYDVYEVWNVTEAGGDPVVQIDLNIAYQTVGINLAENNNPDREEVDHAYRAQAFLLHPDRAASLGAYNQEQLDAMMQALNLFRDHIYQVRGWR